MTRDQILVYLLKASQEAEPCQLRERFRVFANLLPTTVLNAVIPPKSGLLQGPKTNPLDRQVLLIDIGNIVARLIETELRQVADGQRVAMALALEGKRRQYPQLEIYVPVNPFDDVELEKGQRTMAQILPEGSERTNFVRSVDRLFPKTTRRPSRVVRRAITFFAVLVFIWLVWRRWHLKVDAVPAGRPHSIP